MIIISISISSSSITWPHLSSNSLKRVRHGEIGIIVEGSAAVMKTGIIRIRNQSLSGLPKMRWQLYRHRDVTLGIFVSTTAVNTSSIVAYSVLYMPPSPPPSVSHFIYFHHQQNQTQCPRKQICLFHNVMFSHKTHASLSLKLVLRGNLNVIVTVILSVINNEWSFRHN